MPPRRPLRRPHAVRDRRRALAPRHRAGGGGARDRRGARQEAGGPARRQHPDDRLVGHRQDDADAGGRGASSPRDPALALRSTVVRIHANVLGEEAERGRPGEAVLGRLLERAREQLGAGAAGRARCCAARRVAGSSSSTRWTRSARTSAASRTCAGIRAQEALLTLIENEAMPADGCRPGPAAARSPSTRAACSSSAPAPSRGCTTPSTTG